MVDINPTGVVLTGNSLTVDQRPAGGFSGMNPVLLPVGDCVVTLAANVTNFTPFQAQSLGVVFFNSADGENSPLVAFVQRFGNRNESRILKLTSDSFVGVNFQNAGTPLVTPRKTDFSIVVERVGSESVVRFLYGATDQVVTFASIEDLTGWDSVAIGVTSSAPGLLEAEVTLTVS